MWGEATRVAASLKEHVSRTSGNWKGSPEGERWIERERFRNKGLVQKNITGKEQQHAAYLGKEDTVAKKSKRDDAERKRKKKKKTNNSDGSSKEDRIQEERKKSWRQILGKHGAQSTSGASNVPEWSNEPQLAAPDVGFVLGVTLEWGSKKRKWVAGIDYSKLKFSRLLEPLERE